MNRDEIIRSFLDLHPDTPIDMKEYAIPLRIISRMLEAGAAIEREKCAKVCDGLYNDAQNHWQVRVGANNCADAIRARWQS